MTIKYDKDQIPEPGNDQPIGPVVPPQVVRLGKSLDSLVRITFPEGSYHYEESAEGIVTVILSKGQYENLNKVHAMVAVETVVLRLQKAVEELQGIGSSKEPKKVLKDALKTFLGETK